jgi:site-specific recombinase XerD
MEGEIAELAERAAEFATQARARNTLATYRSAWGLYTAWCERFGFSPLSGDPRLIGLYLTDAGLRLSPKSVRVHLSAIASAHRLTGIGLDAKHYNITSVMGGVERAKGRRERNAKSPVLLDQLRAMLRDLGDAPLEVRNRAMLLLGFGGAMRRSELVGLDLEDLEIREEGVRILIRRSKTDQYGEGQSVVVLGSQDRTICVVSALKRWLSHRGLRNGPLFCRIAPTGIVSEHRLSDRGVARIVKERAAAASLDETKFSGHSLRAGFATTAAIGGADLKDIMQQGRWESMDTALLYIREADLWRRNASGVVFGQDTAPS